MVQPEARTPFVNRLKRLGAAEILAKTYLHLEIKNNPESARRIHELAEQDFGFIEIVNHWGLMEFPAVFSFNFKNRDLRKAKALSAYTAYRFEEKHNLLSRTHFSLAFDRTMTPDAVDYYAKHPEDKPDNADQLNSIFVKDAATILSQGGVVTMTPQGQRDNFLPEKYRKRMLGTFLTGLRQEGVNFNNLAFIFIATGLKDVANYSLWRNTKYNEPHPPIQVTLGPVYTFNETPMPGRIISIADKWARAEQAKIVSPAFLTNV